MMESRVKFFFTPTNISGTMQRSLEQLKKMETYFESLKKQPYKVIQVPGSPNILNWLEKTLFTTSTKVRPCAPSSDRVDANSHC